MAKRNEVNHVAIFIRAKTTPRGLEEWTEVTFQRYRVDKNLLFHKTYDIITHSSFKRLTRLLGDCAK